MQCSVTKFRATGCCVLVLCVLVYMQIHGYVCMAAVVVTDTLDWKLHGFDLTSEHALTGGAGGCGSSGSCGSSGTSMLCRRDCWGAGLRQLVGGKHSAAYSTHDCACWCAWFCQETAAAAAHDCVYMG